jgi:rod shape determining protein RodA
VVLGLTLYFFLTYSNYKILQYPQVFGGLYVVTVILLIFLLIFGVEINNVKRWIQISGFRFQVSEIAKLVVIITTVGIMTMKNEYNEYLLTFISFILSLIIAVLIFLEPDASTSIIVMVIWFLTAFASMSRQLLNAGFLLILGCAAAGMIFFLSSNIMWAVVMLSISAIAIVIVFIKAEKFKYIALATVILGLLLGFAGEFGWNNVLQDYQKDRIESYINPEEDIQGSGFQVAQSKVAIGSGMILGKGFGHGTQSKLKFLPEHQTDFIFATFAEEFGLVGSLFLLSLYSYAVFRILNISTKASDMFGSMLCIGIAMKLLVEVFINVGMNLGVIPATGIPLPLMSAGGSIFLVTMIALGLVQNVYVNRDEISG